MTLKSPWMAAAWTALLTMIASCAGLPQESVRPPRLDLPSMTTQPCVLERLPEQPTLADLEAAYMLRGLRLVECDAARALAVATLLDERDLQDRWRNGRP